MNPSSLVTLDYADPQAVKKLSPQRTVSAQLYHTRRIFGLTLEEIAEDIKIRPEVLYALEHGEFSRIEEPLYRTLMVKTYAEYLGLDWSQLSREYLRESVFSEMSDQEGKPSAQTVGRGDLIVAPRLFKHIVLSVGMIGACVYVMVLAAGALSRPMLTVSNPPDNFLTSSKTLRVEGAVSPEATLAINGQEVLKSRDGNFYQDITLSAGINTIHVAAVKKYSKEIRVTRTVLYEPPILPLTLHDQSYGTNTY